MRGLRVLVVASFACAGCLSPPVLPPRPDSGVHDASLPAFALVGIAVMDARGHDWPASAAPRTPTFSLTFTSAPSDPTNVLLLDGAADADLAGDLDLTPYRTATLDRAIDVQVTLDGSVLTLVPMTPLAGGQIVTVAIPHWLEDAEGHRLDAATTQSFVISMQADAGARATDAWPPDGAFDVATDIALVAVRFDGTLDDPTHAVTLAEVGAGFVPSTLRVVICSSVGWTDGVCLELVPTAPLRSGTDFAIAIAASAHDATGAAIPAFGARFHTADGEPAPLVWTSVACAIGETMDTSGCTRADDESISFRGQLSAGARLMWTAGAAHGSTLAARGGVALRVGDLSASTSMPFAIDAFDYAGAAITLSLPLSTTEPLATIAITEVRADPLGAEPRQEYVEIENYGATAVSLDGMHLADAATSEGDALPAVSIPAGAHALIVSSAFAADDVASGDVAAPAGAILVRVDASLGSGGLSNAGEPLYLRDALERWISAAPATPPPRSGVCIVRASTSHRVGDPGSFRYDPALTCTPGR